MYARETDVVEAINDPAVRENTTFLKVGLYTSVHQPLSGPGLTCRVPPQPGGDFRRWSRDSHSVGSP